MKSMTKLIASAVFAITTSGALTCGIILVYDYVIGDATFSSKIREVREMGACAPVLEGAAAEVRIDAHWAPDDPENVQFTGELLDTGLTISGIGVMSDDVFEIQQPRRGRKSTNVRAKVSVSYIEIYDGDQLICVDDGGFTFQVWGTGVYLSFPCQ